MSNDDFARSLDTSDEWIRSRTGIKQRRIAAAGETPTTLGTEAARKALAAARLAPADVDLIVCATATPERLCPSTACTIQAALGCRTVPAFDVMAACSGFLYALAVADSFIRVGTARHALVIGTETLSRILDYQERASCILFGDGAGACVLSAGTETGRGLRRVTLGADGRGGGLIQVPGVCHQTPFFPRPESMPDFLTLHGREVFRFAVTKMTQLLREALAEGPVDLLVPHQVNQRIIDVALQETGYPAEKVMVNLEQYGNTAAASVPVALDEAIRTERVKPGGNVLLMAFGGGLTWGSALLTV
jgi:3-oxoacyl-[acyl-carrier-protein] synthase-3